MIFFYKIMNDSWNINAQIKREKDGIYEITLNIYSETTALGVFSININISILTNNLAEKNEKLSCTM